MNNLQPNTAAEQAAAAMTGHQYHCLASNEHIEAWRCAEPGTSIYAFDILITRYGIAVVGDIDNMTFSVGMNYGLEFLARDSVDCYMYGKLSQESREKEIDRAALLRFCCQNWLPLIAERIEKGSSDESIQSLESLLSGKQMPTAWIRRHTQDSWGELKDLRQFRHLVDALRQWDSEGVIAPQAMELEGIDLFDLSCTIESLDDLSCHDPQSVYHILQNAPYGACELSEWTFHQRSHGAMVRLNMINIAAKAIIQAKAEKLSTEKQPLKPNRSL